MPRIHHTSAPRPVSTNSFLQDAINSFTIAVKNSPLNEGKKKFAIAQVQTVCVCLCVCVWGGGGSHACLRRSSTSLGSHRGRISRVARVSDTCHFATTHE